MRCLVCPHVKFPQKTDKNHHRGRDVTDETWPLGRNSMKRVVVVGGVAGGASFAARVRRLDESASIVILDKGDYVSFANCGLPYYVGGIIKERNNLIIQTPQKLRDRFNIDVRVRSEVLSVDPAGKKVIIRSGDKTADEPFDYLLLSPGCTPVATHPRHRFPPCPHLANHSRHRHNQGVDRQRKCATRSGNRWRVYRPRNDGKPAAAWAGSLSC